MVAKNSVSISVDVHDRPRNYTIIFMVWSKEWKEAGITIFVQEACKFVLKYDFMENAFTTIFRLKMAGQTKKFLRFLPLIVPQGSKSICHAALLKIT